MKLFSPRILVLAASSAAMMAQGAVPDFNRDVRPILSDRCFHCHGPDQSKRKGKLRLDTPEGAAKALSKEHPAESELVTRITSTDPDEVMPPADGNIGKKLSAAEIGILKEWVAAGAPYARHWAFVAPQRAPLPSDSSAANPVDAFLRARLKAEGLALSPSASRATVARRLFLDLTGLPPAARDVEEFVRDTRPDAYARMVERVLASPHYGERMTLLWMDLARYGDSSVYHADGPREMWGWRDWVISAFNANMPYKQFTLEQLAGDLLPNASLSQKIATGFNRNHATTDEGGVIAEEFRVDYVVDRVKTTSNVWLGLSMECAQCHDHKYDPVTQAEYYQFYAYFNNTRDPGMQTRSGNTAPMVDIPDPEAATKQRLAREASTSALKTLSDHRSSKAASKTFAEWAQPKQGSAESAFPTSGVILHVPCREPEKTQLVSTLEGLSGSTSGVAFAKAERPGAGALTLAGNAGVKFTEGPQLDGSQPFTFAAWVNLSDTKGAASVLTRMVAGDSYRGFDFGFDNGRPGLHLVHQWPSNALKAYGVEALTPKQWHHVVISYDGSRKVAGARLSVDGKPMDLKIAADSLSASAESPAPMVLGGRQDSSRFKGDLAAVTLWSRALTEGEISQAGGDYVDALRLRPVSERSDAERAALERAFAMYVEPAGVAQFNAYAKALDAQEKSAKGLSNVMVMEDLPAAQMRPTYVLTRGQYDAPDKNREVKPGVPAVFPPVPEGAPQNRLGLAQWLVDRQHPLTARVTVNRFWQMLFGEGLVRTSEDFGLQGEVASHQDLLDWLAVDFMESGWDVKALLRKIVLSDAYQQSARTTPELLERDPENRLLARGPRFRLQAEFLRDEALAVSGLLNAAVGGPSVKPYQPKGIWEEVALDTNLSKFTPDSGEKLYRRSMYTYWKRSSPHPSMTTFDATTREKCTGRRSRTNTPLQALVTLNDPQFVEAGRAFAQRVLIEGGTTAGERISFAIRSALGREPRAAEQQLLTGLLERERARFQQQPERAKQLLAIGESPRNAALAADEHAAWTVVANTILNLDEFLTKP